MTPGLSARYNADILAPEEFSVRDTVRDEITAALDALRTEGWTLPETLEVPLDRPKRPEHGDLATNVALLVQKHVGKPPRVIAEALAAGLTAASSRPDRAIASVEIAGPGFLNLRVRDHAFHAVIERVAREGALYGTARERRPGRVLVEYVSANPTGPLHIAHARGAVVGDALVRVMRAAGYDVATEYYVNDAGQKVINLAWTARMVAHAQPLWLLPEAYRGEYVAALATELRAKHPALLAAPQGFNVVDAATFDGLRADYVAGKSTVEALLHRTASAASDPSDRPLAAACVTVLMGRIQATLTRLGLVFDRYFSEHELVSNGTVPALVADWQARGLAVARDGAVFFKVSEASSEDDKDRVLRKSSGDYTYFATDVAYHRDKLARGFTHLIDVWGADHHGYIPRVRAALEALGLPKAAFEVLLMQMVSLVKDGQPYKMSKTSGSFITIDEVLDEIDASAGRDGAGADALRYFLLSRSHDSPMAIDIDLAKRQSVDNPVFYAQYSHARMNQILERAATAPEFADARAAGLLSLPDGFDPGLAARLTLREEKDLLARCDAFPQVVREAAEHRGPHRVVFFVQELAEAFASYYTRLQKVHDDAILPGIVPRVGRGLGRAVGLGKDPRAAHVVARGQTGLRERARAGRRRGAGSHGEARCAERRRRRGGGRRRGRLIRRPASDEPAGSECRVRESNGGGRGMEAIGMMCDLDQIRERDEGRDSQKLVLVGLGGLAAACVLFAAGVLIGREGESAHAPRRDDPLARLDALAGQVADAGPPSVTYPSRLVDTPSAGEPAPSTQGATGLSGTRPGPVALSEATDPSAGRAGANVPASALLETTGRVRETLPTAAQLPIAPTNQLLRIAPSVGSGVPSGPAAMGSDGPFTLQVSSFRTGSAAQLFAQRLRERGHRAYVAAPATAPNGAVWHRVRVGPFTSQREAAHYRAEFEARERLPTFVVRRDDPAHATVRGE